MSDPPRRTSPRLAIDARKIFDGGIGRHIREIVRRLPEVLPGWPICLFVPPGLDELLAAHGFTPDRFRLLAEPSGKYGLRELWRLPRRAREIDCRLFHSPHYVLPSSLPCPSVVTIHDVIHIDRPATPLHRWYASVSIRGACRRAAAVITVSRHTAEALARHTGLVPSAIRVVPNGVAAPAVSGSATGGGGYVLYVGSLKPHKNVSTLIDAFASASARSGLELWLAGHWVREDRYRRALERRVAALGLTNRVRFLGAFPERSLEVLYRRAELFVSPSWEEGFGLPALEALARRLPVVASRRGAQPEVLGDAARYVDGADPVELGSAIVEVASDAGIRARLGALGPARAEQFSWDTAAAGTAAVYREVLNL